MYRDRYLKIVLTVIALELGWIAVKDMVTVPVAAQNEPAPTPVIIRGVEIGANRETSLPVSVRASTTIRVNSDRPLQIDASRPIVVETSQRPLLVQSVPATPAARPGP